MLAALFTTTTALPPPPRKRSKRHCSIRTSKTKDARARKKERKDIEPARIASFLDEEARQMRDRELVIGESNST